MITYKIRIDLQSERERYEDIVFTTGDKHGYCLEFSFYDNGQKMNTAGYGLTVKAKRADGAVIIDSAVTDENGARYVVADNAFGAAGELELEIALSRADGSYVTAKVLHMMVREGFGEEGLAAADNEPILAKLEAQALAVQGAVNTMQSDLSAHKTDAAAHEEAFAAERKRFNPLYCNALFGSADGASITVNDAVEGTPLALTLYGKCTETLSDSTAEKSPDNPAVITGIGESGSVTVTVTAADGTAQEIEIPLSAPLYGIKHDTTGEWLARDEIRVSDGKVTLTRNTVKKVLNGASSAYLQNKDSVCVLLYVGAYWIQSAYDPMTHAVICSQFKTGAKFVSTPNDILLGYVGGYAGYILISIPRETLGVAEGATKEECLAAYKAWVTAYNAESAVPLTAVYRSSMQITDITDTEAGQALLALVSQNGATITNSEGADMEVTYNRDINMALAEIKNAVAALGTV